MSENNKIYVTTSSQTISTNIKVDNSGYFTEKAQQYAEQSEASAQKSQANVDRLLENEDFINISENLDLIIEAGQKIEGIDLEAILNAEASAKASSESALASASLSEENAQTTTTNAQLSKTYRDECEDFSETSKGYAENTQYLYTQTQIETQRATEQATISTTQANNSSTYANNSLTYSNNAKTSETNALTYSNNAKTSETNALTYSNKAKGYLDEVKEIVPTNFLTLPIGSVISVNASANYTPSGFLPCDGAEYSKSQFEQLWDNYLTGTSINLYAFYADSMYGGETVTLYSKTSTPTVSDTFYFYENGVLVENTSFSILEANSSYIQFSYGEENYIATANRNTSQDTSQDFGSPLLNTCTYDEYESDLATYGQCGKFAVKPLEYDGSGLTIVGSPTITDDGVASGLNKTNYVNTSVTYADIKDKSWEISTQAFVGTDASTNNASVILLDNSYRTLGSVFYNGGLNFCAKFGDSSSSTGEKYVAKLGVVPEGWYNISLSFDISTGTYTLYAQNIETLAEYQNTYTPTTENKQLYSLNTKSSSTILRIGSGDANKSLTCDLKQFSITVDGQTVFDFVEGDTFKVPTIEDTELGLKNLVAVANGTVDDCLATWNTLVELENYLKGV